IRGLQNSKTEERRDACLPDRILRSCNLRISTLHSCIFQFRFFHFLPAGQARYASRNSKTILSCKQYAFIWTTYPIITTLSDVRKHHQFQAGDGAWPPFFVMPRIVTVRAKGTSEEDTISLVLSQDAVCVGPDGDPYCGVTLNADQARYLAERLTNLATEIENT